MIVRQGREVNIFDGWGRTEIFKLQTKHVVQAFSTCVHKGKRKLSQCKIGSCCLDYSLSYEILLATQNRKPSYVTSV